MRILKIALTIAVGFVAFVAITFSSFAVNDGISHTLLKSVDFPGGEPPDGFWVVLRTAGTTGSEDTITTERWKSVATLRASGRKVSFLIPGKEGMRPSNEHNYTYTIVENRKGSQIIEVIYGNGGRSWSRYEAFDDHIAPVSYRTDLGALVGGAIFWTAAVLGFFIGRRATNFLRQKLGVA